jgi:hypothetical protein
VVAVVALLVVVAVAERVVFYQRLWLSLLVLHYQ